MKKMPVSVLLIWRVLKLAALPCRKLGDTSTWRHDIPEYIVREMVWKVESRSDHRGFDAR